MQVTRARRLDDWVMRAKHRAAARARTCVMMVWPPLAASDTLFASSKSQPLSVRCWLIGCAVNDMRSLWLLSYQWMPMRMHGVTVCCGAALLVVLPAAFALLSCSDPGASFSAITFTTSRTPLDQGARLILRASANNRKHSLCCCFNDFVSIFQSLRETQRVQECR